MRFFPRKDAPSFPPIDPSSAARLSLCLAVVERGKGDAALDAFRAFGMAGGFLWRGEGTAVREVRSILGIEDNAKDIAFGFLRSAVVADALARLHAEIAAGTLGLGIAFSLALSAFAGARAYRFLADAANPTKEEEKMTAKTPGLPANEEKKKSGFEAVLVLVNAGYSDVVMDAAREEGARGGTIVRARGTGTKEMEERYGISITPEKELILILVPAAIREAVLTAVARAAGLSTHGQGIAFSLPVEAVVGLKLAEEGES